MLPFQEREKEKRLERVGQYISNGHQKRFKVKPFVVLLLSLPQCNEIRGIVSCFSCCRQFDLLSQPLHCKHREGRIDLATTSEMSRTEACWPTWKNEAHAAALSQLAVYLCSPGSRSSRITPVLLVLCVIEPVIKVKAIVVDRYAHGHMLFWLLIHRLIAIWHFYSRS